MRSPEPRGISRRTGFFDTSGTELCSPPKTRACPTGSSAANSCRASKARKPQSSSLRDSVARSRPVLRPLSTTIRRCPFCTAEPTSPKPDSSTLPVLRPSAPRSMVSSGLRFCCRILFQVNSFSPNIR
jgi:hypothetical protein